MSGQPLRLRLVAHGVGRFWGWQFWVWQLSEGRIVGQGWHASGRWWLCGCGMRGRRDGARAVRLIILVQNTGGGGGKGGQCMHIWPTTPLGCGACVSGGTWFGAHRRDCLFGAMTLLRAICEPHTSCGVRWKAGDCSTA